MLNLNLKPFGLNISDTSIEVISLGGTIKNPKLLTMGRVVLEPGLIEDGIFLDKEKLVGLFRKFIGTLPFRGIKSREFVFSIPESKSFVFNFSLPPDINKEEISEIVKKEIVQTIPFSLEDIYFDFQLVRSGKEALVVAAQKKTIDKYLEFFADLKIKPIAIENETLSMGRAVIDTNDPVFMIDIGAKATNFSIFDKKELRLSISNPVAGEKFTKGIAEKLNITLQKAELLKKETGFDHQKKAGKIFLILQKEIQPLLEEIKKIKKYFQEKEEKIFKKIILAGGSAVLPDLKNYLSENLQNEVLIADPFENININILRNKKYFKGILKIQTVFYSAAMGAALRGLSGQLLKKGINLTKK